MTRVLVTGSRIWQNTETIERALVMVAEDFEAPFVLVHGGAAGADRMAAWAARNMGWEIEEHQADWYTWGRAAGYIRNRHMVDLGAAVCVAFIRNDSAGASMCADIADRAGIPTRRYLDT